MNKWSILGIVQTKDKDVIKQAYRNKLVGVNPEDDQDGFMALRNAYEDALREADEEENETEDDEIIKELMNVYIDFKRRISVEEWQKIFSKDEFVALDTSQESLYKVLEFLMKYNYIPHKVFKYIAEFFDLESIKNELIEAFPENFISFIFNNATYQDSINYELFDTVNDSIDNFISTFYKLENAIQSRAVEQEEKYIGILDSFDIYHPYVEMQKLIHKLHVINTKVNSNDERIEKYNNEIMELLIKAESIVDKYNNDVFLLISCSNLAIACHEYDIAQKYCTKVKEIDPNSYYAKGIMGDIYYVKGDYEKSRDVFLELLDINRYDQGAIHGLERANTALIEQYKKELAENDNQETKLKLTWCYYRNRLFDDGIEVLTSFEPADEHKKEYYNLLGRNYFYTNRIEKALDMFLKWKNAYGNPSTDNFEDQKDKERYGYLHFFISECYIKMGKLDEARKYIEVSINYEHDLNTASYETLCEIEYQSENYEKCISVCEDALKKRETFDLYMYMAKSFDKLGEYGRAINACENAIRNEPYFCDPYLLELEIYYEFNEYDDIRLVLEKLERSGLNVEDSERISFYKAKLLSHENDYEGANEILERIAKNKDSEDADMDDYYKVYIGLAVNYDNLGIAESALENFIYALEEDPGNSAIMERIAEIYHELRRYEDSLHYYDEIINTNDEEYQKNAYVGKASVLGCLRRFEEAKLVYEKCEEEYGLNGYYVIDHAELLVRMDNLQDCVKLLEKCIAEVEDINFVRMCLGNLCCFYGNEGYIDDAYRIFNMTHEKIEDEIEIYRSMGLIYLDHQMYEQAKEMFENVVMLDTDRKTFAYGSYLIAIGKTDDVFKPEYKKYVDLAKEQLEKYSENNRPYICIKKAEIYRGLKQYDEALKVIDIAIANKGNATCFDGNYDAWYEKGCIYEELGDYKKALECYKMALEIFGHEKLFEECVKRCVQRLK